MKTTLSKIGILILMLSIGSAACKKDKKDDTKISFKYNQKEAEIGTALGMQYGESPVTGVFGIELEFLEKTLTVHYTNNYPDSLSGKGDALAVTFLTDKVNEITPGVYNYLPLTQALTAYSIYGDGESFLMINLDSSSQVDPTEVDVTGGKVTVGKSGNVYEFTFDLTTSVNTTITGYYKGQPTIYNQKKKKAGMHQNWFPQVNGNR